MKKKQIIIVIVGAAILAATGFAQYLYLTKVFEDKYSSSIKTADSIYEVSEEPDLQNKLESMKARNAVLLTLAKEKNRHISELKEKLLKTENYSSPTDAGYSDIALSSEFVTLEHSSRGEVAEKLAAFVSEMTKDMDEEQATALSEEFGAFIESLNTDISDIPVTVRKANALAELQNKLDNTQSDSSKKLLQQRIDAINNASEENLPEVLAYYQRLDDIQTMNSLMKKFNLGREELREAGIEPPPRSQWGPDPLEMAVNLDTFSEMYKPLLSTEKQDVFTEDISNYLDELTRWRSDAEVRSKKEEWKANTEEYLAKQLQSLQETTGLDDATMEKKLSRLEKSIAKRLRWIESASLNKVRSMIQKEQMGELSNLLDEYDIPSSELRQYGVIISSGRSRGRH